MIVRLRLPSRRRTGSQERIHPVIGIIIIMIMIIVVIIIQIIMMVMIVRLRLRKVSEFT